MKLHPTRLEGLILIEPRLHSDERGFFLESFRGQDYAAIGVDMDFVQDNHSRSARGSVRGLHFQERPGQSKLVRVAHGAAFDVVVDIRRGSPTFGEWEAFRLDDDRHLQLYIPIGFAHGFCALTDPVDFVYKVSSYYDVRTERGIAWDDEEIDIEWPVAAPVVSARDGANPRLRDIEWQLPSW